MKLQEILDQLRYGELAQLSIGGEPAGEFNDRNYPAIMTHINMGLTALHKRFPIRKRFLTLDTSDQLQDYVLSKDYAVANTKSRETTRYILDSTARPFQEGLLKIESVTNEEGKEFRLNTGSRWDLSTPSYNILHFPKNMPQEFWTLTMEVEYRASHPAIVVGLGYFDPERIEVELPHAYLEPLMFYIASRINNPIGLGQEFNAGNSYYMRYEAACAELEAKGLYVDDGNDNDRFRKGGWI